MKDKLLSMVNEQHRVIAVGEEHDSSLRIRKLFASLLPDLKNLGFTHVALEFFEENRTAIDDYVSGSISADQLQSKVPSNFPYEGFTEIFQSASESGLIFLLVNSVGSLSERDEHMAGIIALCLNQSKSHKVAFHAGLGHTWFNGNATSACELLVRGEMAVLAREEVFSLASGNQIFISRQIERGQLSLTDGMLVASQKDLKAAVARHEWGVFEHNLKTFDNMSPKPHWWDTIIWQTC